MQDDRWIKEVLEFDDDADNREFSDVELVGEKRAFSDVEEANFVSDVKAMLIRRSTSGNTKGV